MDSDLKSGVFSVADFSDFFGDDFSPIADFFSGIFSGDDFFDGDFSAAEFRRCPPDFAADRRMGVGFLASRFGLRADLDEAADFFALRFSDDADLASDILCDYIAPQNKNQAKKNQREKSSGEIPA